MEESNHEFADHWFHSPSSLERACGLRLVKAGQNIAKPNYYMGPRFISYYSFHFIRTGGLVFNQSNVLGAGDMFCLCPNITHQYGYPNKERERLQGSTRFQSAEPLRMFWIALDGKQAPILAKMIGITHTQPILRDILDVNVEQVIGQICETLKETVDTSSPSRNDAKILSLIYLLFHEISIQIVGHLSEEKDDWLCKAEEYMRLHCLDGITVHDVVRHVGLSRSHFSRSFTSRFGLSPNDFIQNIRMDKAVEMLEKSQYSITEIALSIGYPDLYSFTRAFSRHFSLSPSSYRKNRFEA